MKDPSMNPREEKTILRKIINKEYSERKDSDEDEDENDEMNRIPVGQRAIEQAQARRGSGNIANISGGGGLNYREY